MERILADFEKQVLPHVTHWNHPGFMAYFATTGSAPGVLGDLLASALNPIGLLWKTCPALVELEQVTLRWLAEWMGLPKDWFAMTLGGASTGTIHAVIAAREAALAADRAKGRGGDPSRLTLYTSAHAHSSVEKAALALGLNREHCRKIAVDEAYPDASLKASPKRLTRILPRACVHSAWLPPSAQRQRRVSTRSPPLRMSVNAMLSGCMWTPLTPDPRRSFQKNGTSWTAASVPTHSFSIRTSGCSCRWI